MKKKRWRFLIIIGIILYALTYWDILYLSKQEESNNYFKDYITNNHFLIKKKFDYIYHIDGLKNNILLKKIVIKQVGLLGEENIIYESREVETLTQENIFISISPFLTKKITVSMLLEIEEEKILITKDFFPVFEYGTYELWKFFFPIMWEMIQKVPIIRMG